VKTPKRLPKKPNPKKTTPNKKEPSIRRLFFDSFILASKYSILSQ
jgi:hypothetical protein